jgi:hypothetical protein
MCELKNEFLLCTCQEDNLDENNISWIVFRRKEHTEIEPLQIPREIGQRMLPSNELIAAKHKEKYQQYLREFLEEEKRKAELKQIKETEEYLKTTAYILTQLNTRNCFDTEIELIDKDVLSIKLNSELGLWAEFMYRKRSWKLAKFSFDESKYLTIINGRIKSS